MLNDIVEARHIDAFRVFLRFSDGRSGEVDLAPLLKFTGGFERLRDPHHFVRL